MNEPEITLRRLGYDDECWRAEVCASNGLFVATFAFYTHPTELEPFAQSLITFPRDIHDEARFEQGQPKEPTYYLLIRAFLYDGSGHSAIEFSARGHSSERFSPSSRFFILAEASALNRLGQQLLRWLEHADEPLSWKPRNA